MKITDLKPADGARRKPKRVGRGESSGWGKTAARGHKGQMARSGAKHRAWFEGGQLPLQRRQPMRGFNNAKFKKRIAIVKLADIDRKFDDGDEVTVAALCALGLIPGRKDADGNWQLHQDYQGVKLLANGDVSKKLTVKIGAVSAAARQKIEQAGGTVAAE